MMDLKKQSFSWVPELLKTVKGPCSVLSIPSLSSLQNLLKVLIQPKTGIPCTVISVFYENKLLTIPQIEILAKNIAKPEIINGTIIGDIKILMIKALYGMYFELNPNAARVPNTVAPIVAKRAIIKLFLNANPQGFFVQ